MTVLQVAAGSRQGAVPPCCAGLFRPIYDDLQRLHAPAPHSGARQSAEHRATSAERWASSRRALAAVSKGVDLSYASDSAARNYTPKDVWAGQADHRHALLHAAHRLGISSAARGARCVDGSVVGAGSEAGADFVALPGPASVVRLKEACGPFSAAKILRAALDEETISHAMDDWVLMQH